MTEERILLWGYVVYLGLWRAWLKKIVMVFYAWKMGQLSAILAPAPSFPLVVRTDPGGMRTRCGTKHSISASDITAVSSAVSACAINSVAERADCLCRKYLTPDPKPWEIDFFSSMEVLNWIFASASIMKYECLFMLALRLCVWVLAEYFVKKCDGISCALWWIYDHWLSFETQIDWMWRIQ